MLSKYVQLTSHEETRPATQPSSYVERHCERGALLALDMMGGRGRMDGSILYIKYYYLSLSLGRVQNYTQQG